MNTLVNSDNILEISNLSKVYHTNKSEIPAIKDLNLNTPRPQPRKLNPSDL